jgi:hypothetical protein
MNKKLVTNSYKLNAIVETFRAILGNNYYLFAAKSNPYEISDSIIETPIDNEDYLNKIYREIIFGKKITEFDGTIAIKRNNWVSGNVYNQYDSSVANLNNYYVTVQEGSYFHTYKCLYNNKGAKSTIAPDFTSASTNDNYFETSDGYIWKYIFSITEFLENRFATEVHFPVIPSPIVTAAAVDGALDIIKVVGVGNNYSNYLAGLNTFSSNALRLNGNNLVYDISSNSSASAANDYYNGCYIYIKSGPSGEIGQYRKIIDYQVNSTSKSIILDSPFTNSISTSVNFDIYPGVIITGDGTQTINAEARAIVNANSNTIDKIDMLNIGKGYQVANAYVYAYPDVGTSNAELKIIYSPKNGHGGNQYKEFGPTYLLLTVSFNSDESGTIIANNDYRTIGILKNPLFANVNVELSLLNGTFINGEPALKIVPTYLGSNGVLQTNSGLFTSTSANFTTQFAANSYIYLSSGTDSMIGVVNNIVNSTSLYLKTNGYFNSTNTEFYIPTIYATSNVISSNSTNLVLTNLSNSIESNNLIVGVLSGARAISNTVYISGLNKGFGTFINMYKYIGNITSGTFIKDEKIYQNSIAEANATLFSTDDSTTIYASDQFGIFETNKNIVGEDSNAIATINEKYTPEIVFKSGELLYIENMSPVSRQDGQSETFKIVFEY